jgi:hypothetical protein
LDSDNAFTAYALILTSGVASVLTASVIAGVSTPPSAGVFLEHVLLGLAIRAAYKSMGGWNWAEWGFTGERAAEATAAAGLPSSPAADAKA